MIVVHVSNASIAAHPGLTLTHSYPERHWRAQPRMAHQSHHRAVHHAVACQRRLARRSRTSQMRDDLGALRLSPNRRTRSTLSVRDSRRASRRAEHGTARAVGVITCSLSASGSRSSTKKPCARMRAFPRRRRRSRATSQLPIRRHRRQSHHLSAAFRCSKTRGRSNPVGATDENPRPTPRSITSRSSSVTSTPRSRSTRWIFVTQEALGHP